MTDNTQPSLDDVLDMLLDAYDAPTHEAVAVFASRYPAYRDALVDFAIAYAQEEHLPEPAPLSDESRARVFSRAQSFFENALFRADTPPPAEAPLAVAASLSLADLAMAAGTTLVEASTLVGMDVPLVTKIKNRGIAVDSIRRHVLRDMAMVLRVGVDQIIASCTGPPRIAQAASFLAQVKPTVAPQEDFAKAVAASSLSDAAKAALLRAD